MKNIPCLTTEYLTSQIEEVRYYHDAVFSPAMTVCHLKMRNGFFIAGESAVLDMAQFDGQRGQEIAYKNAFSKLWQLEGYARACAALDAPTTEMRFFGPSGFELKDATAELRALVAAGTKQPLDDAQASLTDAHLADMIEYLQATRQVRLDAEKGPVWP